MTAQTREKLILDGIETSMAFCPPFPEDHPRIEELSPEDLGRVDKANRGKDAITAWDEIMYSTGCWRRYRGTWLIKEDKFYLAGLEGRFRLTSGEPVFADWFTGVLRVPRGKLLTYVHMVFGSIYEEELHIGVENGIVTESRVWDNRGQDHDWVKLGFESLPGLENNFPTELGRRRRPRSFLDN
jgi:hypothetical protein